MNNNIQAARATLHRREQKRCKHLKSLFKKARQDADRIIEMLVAKYRPQRIYQWGSLLTQKKFREWSDLDFALEGLKNPLDGLRAADDARAITGFPVDLVEMERIHPLHAETIRKEGKLVYESKRKQTGFDIPPGPH